MGISRGVFHLAEAMPDRGKHEALLAPDPGFDPEAHLLELSADPQTGAAFAGVDQNGDGGTGAEERRHFGESRLDRRKRIVTRNQSDRVLRSRNPAGRGGGYPK